MGVYDAAYSTAKIDAAAAGARTKQCARQDFQDSTCQSDAVRLNQTADSDPIAD
jgi:hypothetical protein